MASRSLAVFSLLLLTIYYCSAASLSDPPNQQYCLNVPYNPATHYCTRENIVCRQGQVVCGTSTSGRCYEIGQQYCRHDDGLLCERGHDICGGLDVTSCYNYLEYTCFSWPTNINILCKQPLRGCGPSICFDDRTHYCNWNADYTNFRIIPYNSGK